MLIAVVVVGAIIIKNRRAVPQRTSIEDGVPLAGHTTDTFANPAYKGDRTLPGSVDFMSSSAQVEQETTKGDVNFNGREFRDETVTEGDQYYLEE